MTSSMKETMPTGFLLRKAFWILCLMNALLSRAPRAIPITNVTMMINTIFTFVFIDSSPKSEQRQIEDFLHGRIRHKEELTLRHDVAFDHIVRDQ